MNLSDRIYNGDRAKEVLENEAFIAAFDAIEKEVIDKWTNSPARDSAGREKCWEYLILLRKVKTQLTTTLDTGKLAKLELQHEQSLKDRAKAFVGLN